jgi:hypothetical protein
MNAVFEYFGSSVKDKDVGARDLGLVFRGSAPVSSPRALLREGDVELHIGLLSGSEGVHVLFATTRQAEESGDTSGKNQF